MPFIKLNKLAEERRLRRSRENCGEPRPPRQAFTTAPGLVLRVTYLHTRKYFLQRPALFARSERVTRVKGPSAANPLPRSSWEKGVTSCFQCYVLRVTCYALHACIRCYDTLTLSVSHIKNILFPCILSLKYI